MSGVSYGAGAYDAVAGAGADAGAGSVAVAGAGAGFAWYEASAKSIKI